MKDMEYISTEMPEPAFKLRWHDDGARYTVSKPNIGDTDCYTADQLRQAIATYAAKLAQAEAVLRMAREALGTERIMSQDEDGRYTREITPKVITEAIAAINQQLGEK